MSYIYATPNVQNFYTGRRGMGGVRALATGLGARIATNTISTCCMYVIVCCNIMELVLCAENVAGLLFKVSVE